MHVSGAEWVLIATTVALAATIQGVVGFGGNLLSVPIVALVVPAALSGRHGAPELPDGVGDGRPSNATTWTGGAASSW